MQPALAALEPVAAASCALRRGRLREKRANPRPKLPSSRRRLRVLAALQTPHPAPALADRAREGSQSATQGRPLCSASTGKAGRAGALALVRLGRRHKVSWARRATWRTLRMAERAASCTFEITACKMEACTVARWQGSPPPEAGTSPGPRQPCPRRHCPSRSAGNPCRRASSRERWALTQHGRTPSTRRAKRSPSGPYNCSGPGLPVAAREVTKYCESTRT
jgi:hypothetical protein